MQPAGQSPQPICTVTSQPEPAGVTSYQDPWPIAPGSRAPSAANRGSRAITIAAASAAVTEDGVGPLGAAAVGEPIAPGALQAIADHASRSEPATPMSRDVEYMPR